MHRCFITKQQAAASKQAARKQASKQAAASKQQQAAASKDFIGIGLFFFTPRISLEMVRFLVCELFFYCLFFSIFLLSRAQGFVCAVNVSFRLTHCQASSDKTKGLAKLLLEPMATALNIYVCIMQGERKNICFFSQPSVQPLAIKSTELK